MNIDSVVIARDAAGKSGGCAFVTMRWKQFHARNPRYDREKVAASVDKGWSHLLKTIMSEQMVCGCKIYVEYARNLRKD